MKKRLCAALLALLLMTAPALAAFSDISDTALSQTVDVLNALGIMQGVGDNRFSPDTVLTRAQFCKIAVVSLGVSDVSAYASYTIFPDVKHSHWAAPYINAAMRHPDLQKTRIIRGYADGTFGPDRIVTFGEACTMLLRMLGYTESDIGPLWPQDYVARAKSLGLTEGVSTVDGAAALRRSDAAKMLLNTLGAAPKEGDKLLTNLSSGTVENSILLATSDTESTLRTSEALFFEGGEAVIRATSGTLDRSMIGLSGTVVLDKGQKSTAIGIVPNHNKVESVTVKSAAADGITTDTGKIKPNRSTPLYTGGTETPGTYAETWANIPSGATLQIYYDENGETSLLAVLPTAAAGSSGAFVYGVTGAVSVPDGYAIEKNGAKIDRSGLKKYDVVTLDAANKKALVSDKRLAGTYTSGTPSFRYPQTVTVLGKTFAISDSAAAYFADAELNKGITLLLDANGAVAAAYPQSTLSAQMRGVVTASGEDAYTVLLTNGVSLSVPASSGAEELVQQYVTVTQSTGSGIKLRKEDLPAKTNGQWDIAAKTLGTSAVSSEVIVFEGPTDFRRWNKVSLGDITSDIVGTASIRSAVKDSSGSIIAVFLNDVTGKSWIYGMGSTVFGTKIDEDGNELPGTTDTDRPIGTVLRYWDGQKMVRTEFGLTTTLRTSKPIAVFAGQENLKKGSLAYQELTLVGTVSLSDFSGATSVKTAQGTFEIDPKCGAYVAARNEMISLANARINYTSFKLYADKPFSAGGKICMVIAS